MNKRWEFLDIMKGVGLLAMITVHCLVWWYVYPVNRIEQIDTSIFLAGYIGIGLLVLWLPVSAGAAFFLANKNFLNTNFTLVTTKVRFLSSVLKRAVLIALVGFLLNFLAWGYEATFLWNVLQFYALSIILIAVTHSFFSLREVWLAGILSFFVFTTTAFWQSLFGPSKLKTVLIGDLTQMDIWPLLPWFYLIVIGYAIGYLFLQRDVEQVYTITLLTGMAGCVLGLLGGGFRISIDYSFATIWDMSIQPPVFTMIGMVGLSLFVLGMVGRFLEARRSIITHWLSTLGKAVAIVYVAHMIFGFAYFNNLSETVDISYFVLGYILQMIQATVLAYLYVVTRKRWSDYISTQIG